MQVTPIVESELLNREGLNGIPSHYIRAFEIMCWVKYMAQTYDDNRQICKYVHSTSRGHEAIQIATGLQLRPSDYAAPYYRDEAMLLAMGWQPYELMLQLLAKGDDPFSKGIIIYDVPKNAQRYPAPHRLATCTAALAHVLEAWPTFCATYDPDKMSKKKSKQRPSSA